MCQNMPGKIVFVLEDSDALAGGLRDLVEEQAENQQIEFLHASSVEQGVSLSHRLTSDNCVLILDSLVPVTTEDHVRIVDLLYQREHIVRDYFVDTGEVANAVATHEAIFRLDVEIQALTCSDGAKMVLTAIGDRWRSMPVLLFSASRLDDDPFFQQTNVIHLNKPASVEKVLEVLRKLLGT